MKKRKIQGVQALLIAIAFLLQCLFSSSFVFASSASSDTGYAVLKTIDFIK